MSFIGYLTLAPLAAALIILLLPKEQSRMAALALSAIIFLASLGLLAIPAGDTNLPWIPSIDIRSCCCRHS
jgi:NADH:ubiquinone oxidoreductase subunit 4 (subunit M)